MPELTPEYAPKPTTPNAALVPIMTGERTDPYESVPKDIAFMITLSEMALLALAFLSPDRKERHKSRRALHIRRTARLVEPTRRILMRPGWPLAANGR